VLATPAMTMPHAKKAAALAAGLCVALAVSSARAYILPADAILGSVAKRRESLGFTSLVVEGFRRRGSSDTAEDQVWEAILPGVGHRQEIRGVDGTTVVLTLGQKRWVFKEGERPQGVKTKPSLVTSFLARTDGKLEGRAFLSAYGIDSEVVSLSRIDKQIAFVIGAKPWEPDKAQLWIDKSFRVPVRLVEADPKTKETIDIQMTGYGSAQTGEWWPRVIEVRKNGQLVESTTYTEAKVNEPVDPALFKPPS
jgi:hypothetical protein